VGGLVLGVTVMFPGEAAAKVRSKAETYLSWHDRCLKGDADEIDVQIGRFEVQLAADKGDQLARVYLGSACALRAKASFWGPTKLRYLKRGRALMDAAVTGAPKDPRVRMVRAIGYYKVPERFGTRPVSVKDFEFLVPIAREPKGRLENNERQVILFYAAKCFEEEGKGGAAGLRKLCHQIDPKSQYGKLTK
jgi:hypothetical protein